MKKETKSLATIAFVLFSGFYSFGQNNYYPGTGNVGLGTTSSTSNFNLQVHGTTNYTEYDRNGTGINYGVTSRIGLTNTSTGTTATDGLVMRMSQNDFSLTNRENGNITFQTGSVFLGFSGSLGRGYMGTGNVTGADFGLMNYYTADNGIFIRTTQAGKYGISIRSNSLTDIAMQVMGTDGTTRNFAVQANGNVFARKYTTTLANIPDYVFQPTYKLMSMNELREFIQVNSHLPNVPSASEYAEKGVDLGEMNRVLLEKVEELTLYILQLEDRIQSLEKK